MRSPFRLVVLTALVIALLVAAAMLLWNRSRAQNEAAALAVAHEAHFGQHTLESGIAWNEGRPPRDARVVWKVIGTTDDGLVALSARTPEREYVFDVDVETRRIHPSNPKAIDLFAELRKQE
ncbi:MAG: hypothetical protein H7Z43_05970 [Clostridia bacterium]|nr:hypothetical protein [Deltaproteobacteria bacterium]